MKIHYYKLTNTYHASFKDFNGIGDTFAEAIASCLKNVRFVEGH